MNKLVGTTLLVIGTTIGAGMLALPLTIGLLGLLWGSIALILLWAIMAYAALVTLEANLRQGKGLPINLLVRPYLGKLGEGIAASIALVLFWTLLTAYLTGMASLITSLSASMHFKAAHSLIVLGGSLILGVILFIDIRYLDVINRIFVFTKCLAFLGMIALLLPVVQNVAPSTLSLNLDQLGPWALAIPVLFTAFGFHGSIHSLINYADQNVQVLKKAFVYGSLLSLIIYLTWIWVSIRAIQSHHPEVIAELSSGNFAMGTFMSLLGQSSSQTWLPICTWVFSLLAIASSALGVSLGLFDLFLEKMRPLLSSKAHQKLLALVLTLLIPTSSALISQDAFIAVIRFAAIFLSFIALIFPAWIVICGRLRKICSPYVACPSLLGISILFLLGLCIISLELYNLF